MTATRLPRPLVRGRSGTCACGHPLGAGAAAQVGAAGGNAVDTAVAAAAMLCVVLPDACGIGGDALLLVQDAGGAVRAYNGTGRSPAALEGPIPADGGGTVAVPGLVAALVDAHAGHGRLPLDAVLAPAVLAARDGVPVGEETLRALAAHRHRLERTAADFPLMAGPPGPGALVQHRALAATLSAIGRDGPSAFYGAPLGEAIARAVQADGGPLTAQDLLTHETVVRDPVEATRLGRRLWVQPPVSQATLVPMALAAFPDGAGPADGRQAHVAVEAIEAAFEHRHELDEPGAALALLDFVPEVDPARAARRGGPRSDAHTTAVATADGDGTVVSMLISVFDEFGSATWVPEGGFLMNDRLHGFTAPGCEPRAGRRPVHTLSPIVVGEPGRRFALCTPGSDGQVQTLVQLLLALDAGADLPQALDRPRWRSVDGRLAVEDDLDPEVLAALAERGHDLWRRPPGEARFGAAVAAGVELGTGLPFAAADPRREAWATGW